MHFHIQAIAISAVAGTGKATVSKELIALRPDLYEPVGSITTRPPKPEAHGKKYEYASSHEEFEQFIREGKVLEFNKYASNTTDKGFHYYGTSRASYEDIIARGKVGLLDVDINGLCQMSPILGDSLLSVFLGCEREENHRRLLMRGTESIEEIEARMLTGDTERERVPSLVDQGIIRRIIWYGVAAQAGFAANEIHNLFLEYNKLKCA